MLYCLDTNVISDFVNQNYNMRQRVHEVLANKNNSLAICPIVYYEVLRGLKIVNSKNKLASFLAFYNTEDLIKLSFDYDTAEVAAKIYDDLHRGKQIEDNDIYIVAMTIVTANDKHFSRIADLKVENCR